jgi:hypothetical protein
MFFHKTYESRTEDKSNSKTGEKQNYAVQQRTVNHQHNIEEEPTNCIACSVHDSR